VGRSLRPVILCYHGISSTWRSPLVVPEQVLAAQLEFLAKRGYVGLTYSEAEKRRRDGTLPPRTVVLTFDDGLRTVSSARQLLADYGFPGTVFVVTDFVDAGPAAMRWPGIAHWADRHRDEFVPLDWSDLEAFASAGWEVGAHTKTHPNLLTLDHARLAEEVEESRERIRSRLGACTSFAYPYGHADERAARAVERAGYLSACTLGRSHRIDEPFRRPRIGISAPDVGLKLTLKLSPLYLRLLRTRLAPWLPPTRSGRAAEDSDTAKPPLEQERIAVAEADESPHAGTFHGP
jgi:peptidoglycan/xylan/chitin deacetylase (PgdA/CDA1 family)